MKLFYNPISSYSQKVLIAFYEKGIKFEGSIVNLMDPAARTEFMKVNPLGKVPFMELPEKNWQVPESSIIIEYVDRHFPTGTKLIPDDPDLARQTRMRDRFFDLYVNEPVGKIFFDGMRPAGCSDAFGVERARETIERALAMVDNEIGNRTWAMGDDFTMADCSAAPALGYCRMIQPYDKFKNVTAYYNRLAERPSVQRVMKEAAPLLAAFAKK